MSANNPFNKSGKTPDRKGAEQARRVVENNSGNRAGIGQRRGKTAPKPGNPNAGIGGGRSGGSSGGSSRGTTPSLPKNRPTVPKGGTGTASRRGCASVTGGLLLLMLGAIFVIGNKR